MNVQKHLFGLLLLAAAFIAIPKAHAAGFPTFMAKVTGRNTTVGVASGGTLVVTKAPTGLTPGGGWTSAGNYGVAPGAAGATKIGAEGTLAVGGKAVGVGITGEVAKEAIVGGLLGCARGGAVGCALGVGIPLATAYFGTSGARWNPDTSSFEGVDKTICTLGPCYHWVESHNPGVLYEGQEAACNGYASWYMRTFPGRTSEWHTGPTITQCTGFNKLANGTIDLQGNQNVGINRASSTYAPKSPTWYPMTEQAVKDALYKTDPAPGIVDELAKAGNITWPVTNVEVTGPAEVKGPKVTTVEKIGTRTDTKVSQETTPLSYSKEKVTAGDTVKTTTTTSVTTNPDGSTSTSTSTATETTQVGTEAPKEDEPAPSDTPLPEQPKLYEPKYPNGLEGVWTAQKDRLKSTALSQLTSQLMPSVGSGGTCPTMNVDMDFAQWASFGTRNVAPACEVWDWAKLIVIASALLLARRLIFGG